MRVVQVSSSASISAPPQAVYSLISDYRSGHPRMLPRCYFPRLEVERGGSGAGTIIRFEVRLFGTTRRIRAEISEPKPGEELVETDLATGARTSFIVASRAGGRESEVTIKTEWEANGLRGWLERMMAPSLLRRIYAEQLVQLEAAFAHCPLKPYSFLLPRDAFWRESNMMKIPNTNLAEQLGTEKLGARLWRLPPFSANTWHRHAEQDELYFVLEGTGRIRVAGESLTVPKYGAVLVRPPYLRQVFNDTEEEVLWLIFGAPRHEAGADRSTIYPEDPQQLPAELHDRRWPPK